MNVQVAFAAVTEHEAGDLSDSFARAHRFGKIADRLTDRGGLFRRQRSEAFYMSLRLDNNVAEVGLVVGGMDVSGVDEIVLEDGVPGPFIRPMLVANEAELGRHAGKIARSGTLVASRLGLAGLPQTMRRWSDAPNQMS